MATDADKRSDVKYVLVRSVSLVSQARSDKIAARKNSLRVQPPPSFSGFLRHWFSRAHSCCRNKKPHTRETFNAIHLSPTSTSLAQHTDAGDQTGHRDRTGQRREGKGRGWGYPKVLFASSLGETSCRSLHEGTSVHWTNASGGTLPLLCRRNKRTNRCKSLECHPGQMPPEIAAQLNVPRALQTSLKCWCHRPKCLWLNRG